MRTLGWWALYVGIYLAFISGVTWEEAVAAAAVAALAVALSLAGLRAAGLSFAGALPALWRVAAVAKTAWVETVVVLAALGRHLTGRRRLRGRFVAVALDDRVDAAADAALTVEASVAPNTYVVGVLDAEPRPLLLLHQLEPRPGPRRSFPRLQR